MLLIPIFIPVVFMIPLHNSPTTVSLAAFDDLRLFRVDLEHKLFTIAIIHGSHADIFQRYDSFWNILRCVLEVVQTTIVENKPTSLPSLPASAL